MQVLTVNVGEDVVQVLSRLEGEGWVQGSGVVEGVELKLPGEATDVTRSLRGRLVLVTLAGPIAGPHTVTLARATDVGLELVGGVLVRARSQGVTLAVEHASAAAPAGREASARREVREVREPVSSRTTASASSTSASASASSTAASVPSVSERAEPMPERPAPARSWAEVAAASDEAETSESDETPVRGDLVDHFSFGLSEVIKAEGDRLHLRDLKGAGRVREVVASALRVMPPTRRADGKRVFRLQRKG